MRTNRFVLVVGMLGCLAPLCAVAQNIKTVGGEVSGTAGMDKSVLVFKGIPFAAPPVGDLRWRAPQPAAPWQGVRKADKFSASCMQNTPETLQPWTYEFMTHTEVSEDCLYLNVWTGTKPNEKRPVYVYIYGGGFGSGSAAVPVYDGEGLAKKGLTVVVMNYRVGVMGFLVHPELSKESPNSVSGNYGLLDQIAALKWVKANIANFGGDPSRVTIAGQSAGAMSVHDLVASPLAKGLFQRAIAESGGSTVGGAVLLVQPASIKDAEAAGQRWADAKGAKSIADLRKMSWKELIAPTTAAAGEAATAGRGAGNPGAGNGGARGPSFTSAPVVDGYVLPLSANDAVFQGKHNDVPVLTGMNMGELGGIGGSRPVTLESYRSQAKQQYGDEAERFLALYPATNDEEAAAAQTAANRDQAIVSMNLWAKRRAKMSKTRVFEYMWDHPLPGPDAARYGAFHTSEVPYVMNTVYMSKRPFTEADHTIADTLSSYWANFAANGDPNGKGLPAWPAHSEKIQVMELGDKDQPLSASSAGRQAFFETRLSRP